MEVPESPQRSVLVLDDDQSLRQALQLNLEARGYSVRAASESAEALHLMQGEPFDIILCDLQLQQSSGLAFIQEATRVAPDSAVVLMTGFGSTEIAVQALRAGAYDYLAKPFEMEELVLLLAKLEERERLKEENANLRSAITQRYNFSNIIARSESIKKLFDTVKRLANFSTTVLITGESGTGKELLAKALHHNSPRRGKPFVAINCGAIPEHLMESELFGHRRGAFTDAVRDKKGLFEEATGGTILLDEIGEMPLHLQVKILRALQEQVIRPVGDERAIPVDVRVIAATLRDLEDDVKKGRFRDDLYYRLNVVSMHLPPLRERPEDIPALVEHFIEKHNKRLGLKIDRVHPDAMKLLLGHWWKGNIRELENCIERAMVLSDGSEITTALLPEKMQHQSAALEPSTPFATISDDNLSIKHHGRALEVTLIKRALAKTGGNRTHASKILEISHRALLYKLKEYGLSGE